MESEGRTLKLGSGPCTSRVVDSSTLESKLNDEGIGNEEGLAEHTGVALRGTSEAQTIQYLIERAKSSESQSSFMRSFAYVSGPMAGVLLDLTGTDWRKSLTAQDDLEGLLAKAYGIRLSQPLKSEAEKRSLQYGGNELRTAETAREREAEKTLAQYHSQLVDGPVLVNSGLETRLVEIEANLGRLRFSQLGSILAPIKCAKSGRFSWLSLAESTDSSG
jgi:hypothetical protein